MHLALAVIAAFAAGLVSGMTLILAALRLRRPHPPLPRGRQRLPEDARVIPLQLPGRSGGSAAITTEGQPWESGAGAPAGSGRGNRACK